MQNHHHDHDHPHGHDVGHDHHTGAEIDSKRIAVAFWLNFGFTILEVVGGLMTNSMAVLSDALHDMGDSLSLGLAWYFQKLSQKEVDSRYTYGYRRFSVLGALINVIILSTGSVVIIFLSVRRLMNPEEVESVGMAIMAVLGIAVNGAAVWQMRGSENLNAKVVSLHLLEDVLGWVAVLIGSIIMMFYDAPWIDPVLSLSITLYILYHAIRNLIKALAIFLQKVPPGIEMDKVRTHLEAIPELEDAHDLHVWSLDGRFIVMTLHAQVTPEKTLMQLEQIKFTIHAEMRKLGIHHCTVEFEPVGADCHPCESGEDLKNLAVDDPHAGHSH